MRQIDRFGSRGAGLVKVHSGDRTLVPFVDVQYALLGTVSTPRIDGTILAADNKVVIIADRKRQRSDRNDSRLLL